MNTQRELALASRIEALEARLNIVLRERNNSEIVRDALRQSLEISVASIERIKAQHGPLSVDFAKAITPETI